MFLRGLRRYLSEVLDKSISAPALTFIKNLVTNQYKPNK